ncbi:hypothetical protein FH972_021678 [Carpinus fangiana]|uniref:Uncharacterized protein n=1 Tax=Carpinus fangiana TaxID=176857 RepID=A0A5N6KQK6_9ROSI|nr:hypothetical protein FH972_021678 [Carpinus fangiana]
MNRLRNKKKGGDDVANSVPDLTSPHTPTLNAQAPPKRRWGRKKHVEEHPQAEQSFTLPPTDNFRTSLIMPGLSTRFSMLREADDPFSLIGKASDDSVMPQTRSNFLDDIAEVSSISTHSFRPPFAESDRKASYTSDGYGTDDDSFHVSSAGGGSSSIMSRARPGEGNNLFGGRQKIYKIPVGDSGSVNTLGAGDSRGMRGRALYEDDVSMSAFQRLRLREKQAEQDRQRHDIGEDVDDSQISQSSAGLTADEEKRHTASSTNSGPSMLSAVSTAATSVASPGMSPSNPPSQAPSPNPAAPERSRFGSKRLYESKLDQHQQESQSANLTRLNSIQKRNPSNQSGAKFLPNARSSPDLRGRQERSGSMTQPITELPSDEGLTTFESLRGMRNDSPNANRPRYNAPTITEPENPLSQAISTADRGKATALGAFVRPKQQFDEQQYLKRQQSLMKQRADSRSPSSSTRPSVDQNRPSLDARPGSRPSLDTRPGSRTPSARRPSGDSYRPSAESRFRPPFARAERSFSSSSVNQSESRPGSSRSGGPSAASSPAKARRGAPLAPPAAPAPAPPPQQPAPGAWPVDNTDEDTESDYGDAPQEAIAPEQLQTTHSDRNTPVEMPAPLRRSPPPLFEHPALRAAQEAPTTRREKRNAWNPDMKFADFRTGEHAPSQADGPVEQSDIGTSNDHTDSTRVDGGLSSLRAHMRTVSEASSVYPTPTSNNYTFEDEAGSVPPLPSFEGTLDVDQSKLAIDDQRTAKQIKRATTGESPTVPSFSNIDELDEQSKADLAEWEKELNKRHTRDDSATTQAERDAFADELAQRQRAIRENLKIRVENSSRSSSPGSSKNNTVLESSLRPFGLLRNISSRDAVKHDESARGRLEKSKASTSPSLAGSDGPASPAIGRTLHSRMPAPRQSEERQPRQRSRPRQNSLASESNRDDPLAAPHRSIIDPDHVSATRDRSVSGVSAARSMSSPRKPSEEQSSRSRTFHDVPEEAEPQSRKHSASVASSRQDPSRRPDPAGKHSLEILGLQGSNSSSEQASVKNSIDRPNIRVNTTSPTYRSNTASPLTDASNATPGSSTSSTFPRGEGGTSTNGAYGGASGRNQPHSTFTFPARTPAQKAQKHAHQHAKTVFKSDISEPTLLSSTSNVDTVDLPAGASLRNGATSDVDAVLAGQQAALSNADGLVSTVPSMVTPYASSPSSTALDPSDRTSSATATTTSDATSGRKSPPIGLISAEKGPIPSSVSPPPVPPPMPAAKRRGGFNNFFKRGASRNTPAEDDKENGETDAFDDFVLRPSGGRLRIRKVSDETLGGRRRHQLVADTEMEGGMI